VTYLKALEQQKINNTPTPQKAREQERIKPRAETSKNKNKKKPKKQKNNNKKKTQQQKTIQRITETKSQFFEKTKKSEKLLAKSTKAHREKIQMNKN